MYRSAHFCHGFPGEWADDQAGPPSRQLADALVAKLGQRVTITVPVDQHSYYGWGFECEFAGWRFDVVLNIVPENCSMTFSLAGPFLKRLFHKRPQQQIEEFEQLLDDTLRSLPTISAVTWEAYD